MNLRRFYLVISTIVSIFLFASGIIVIYYINSENIKTGLTDANNPVNGIFQPFISSKDPFNILVLGGDKVNHNSDTMMLVNFDPSTCKVNIMSIPRDTRVVIDKNYRKINYAYPHAGINLAVQTVSELLDVNIKYYVFVDTVAFRNIIDLLGGVDIYIPANMDYDDPTQDLHIHLKKGLRHLDGAQSEQYVRFRDPNHWTSEIKKYYDGSDLKRIEAQQNFISEVIKQKLNIQYLPKLNNVISVMFENIDTNFSINDILKLTGYISKFSTDKLNFISMPGQPYDGSPWYYICDVQKARDITGQYFPCSGSFVNIDADNKNNYTQTGSEKTSGGKTVKKDSGSAGKDTTKDTAENNPSNDDSSLKGGQKPAP